MKRLLNKLFESFRGSSSAAPVPAAASAAPALPAAGVAEADPRAFVEFVVKSLVDTPAEVRVEQAEDDRGTVIKIQCKREEMGRVIGKNGKTIAAVRFLVRVATAQSKKKVSVLVQE